MDWSKFDLSVLQHPKMKKLRAPSRCKALEFVGLSVRDAPLGVVDLYDDEIACYLDLSLDAWKTHRDTWILRGLIIRQVILPDDRHIYEIAFWLLPEQGNPDGKVKDGRRREDWEEPQLPLDPTEAQEADPTNRESMTAAERQAFFRARQRAMKAGEPEPRREEFLAFYRAQRHAETVTEARNAEEPRNVTAQTAIREREERDNSKREGGDVTPARNVTLDSAVTPDAEQAAVAILVEHPLEAARFSQSLAEELVSRYGTEQCQRQAEWLRYRDHDPGKGQLGGLLRRAIEEDWPEPERAIAVRKEREKADQREQAVRSRRSEGEEKEAQIAAFWNRLSPERQTQIEQEARASLPSSMRKILDDPDPTAVKRQMLEGALKKARSEIVSTLLAAQSAPQAGAANRNGIASSGGQDDTF